MAGTISVSELLQRNRLYVEEGHVPFPSLQEVTRGNRSLSVAIVSCVDGRVQPGQFLKLGPAEAFILKTVAGHPQQVFQDLLVLDTLSPLTHLIIMHHTDCGATHVTDEGIRAKLISQLPEYEEEIKRMSFGAISDLEDSLRDDVAWVRKNPYFRADLKANTIAMLYDLKTGVATEIDILEKKRLGKSEL